jgi:very-short-patch-repair endonuclease
MLAALAQVALADWPFWYEAELPAQITTNAFERDLQLRHHLRAISRQHLNVSQSWLRQAARRCLRSEPPIEPSVSREIQAGQLLLAVAASKLVIVLGPGPGAADSGAASLVAVAEWFNRVTGALLILLLPLSWKDHPAVQRTAYESLQIDPPTLDRETGPTGIGYFSNDSSPCGAVTFTASPLPGRPHPNSDAEQRLYRRIIADDELSPLLEFNQSVSVDLGRKYRVDLLCRRHKVAIEVDGDDHFQNSSKYCDDCERDYRLMKHDYLILRLPNLLINSDLEMAVERIRDILRLRSKSV